MAVACDHGAAIFHFISPTGGWLVGLSAARFARMAATASHCNDLFHIVAKQEPYLLPERHIGLEVCEKCPGVGLVVRVAMPFHGYFTPIRGSTLST